MKTYIVTVNEINEAEYGTKAYQGTKTIQEACDCARKFNKQFKESNDGGLLLIIESVEPNKILFETII